MADIQIRVVVHVVVVDGVGGRMAAVTPGTAAAAVCGRRRTGDLR